MAMTSVAGHLLNFGFSGEYKKWQAVDPVELFDAPVTKHCPENFKDVKVNYQQCGYLVVMLLKNCLLNYIQTNLEREAAYANVLIIWTDCDREGENIGFEVIDVCQQFNPRLRIYRAKLSEITPTAVTRAVNNLIAPDKRVSDAVDVRSELDLRIGMNMHMDQSITTY